MAWLYEGQLTSLSTSECSSGACEQRISKDGEVCTLGPSDLYYIGFEGDDSYAMGEEKHG